MGRRSINVRGVAVHAVWLACARDPRSLRFAERLAHIGIQASLSTRRLRTPVIGVIARGAQWLNCAMRGAMEPRVEQFSR